MLDFILGKEIAAYVRPHRKLLFFSIFLMSVSTLFALVPAYLLQPFLDQGMKNGTELVTWKIPWITMDSKSWFTWHRTELTIVKAITAHKLIIILAIVAVLSVLFRSLTVYFGELCSAAFSSRAVRSLRIDIFNKLISLPLGFHQKQKSGELIARATADVGIMQNVIVNILIGLIEHPLSALVFLVYLLIMNYKLTLIIFTITPVVIGLIRLFGRKVKKHAVRVQNATADVTSAYQEALLCIKVVLGFDKGDYERKRFSHLADNLYKRFMHWARWDLGMKPMLDATVFLALPAILFAGKTTFDHSLGELVAMFYAFSKIYTPVKKLAKVSNNLKTLQGATTRVFAIMNTVPDIRDAPHAGILPRHGKSIEFRDVCFSYSPNKPILKDISFKVNAGEMVAFVGSTGAGKSTIVELVPRFYDVTSGSITIDGIDIRDVTLNSLRSQIGIVSQKTLLFNTSIEDNIAYGWKEKDRKRIEEAARAANAHHFIMEQPDGYDTVIGDQGTLLSGGQRQRLSIARATLIDPAILILDEAASALDAESEKLVQTAIENLQGSRTILIVAHRLSTITKADRILVIEDGSVVESGTLQELLALNGRFRLLYDIQFGKEND